MEAAYVAKKRGHEVVLCEKSNELGGQLRLAAVPIAKQELCKVIKFMIRRLDHEGIEVRLNTEVTKEMLENEFKDLENLNNIIEEKIPNAKWNIDTVLINEMILEKQGLKKENIIDSGICSVCNSDIIHSYRVEKKGYGLNTALISLN